VSAHLSVAERIGIGAACLGVVPLAWLGILRLRGRRLDVAYTWLALAFGVSAVADVAAFWMAPADRPVVSIVYPISQTAIIAAVFLIRRDALIVAAGLCLVALAVVAWRGVQQPDVVFRSIAWLVLVRLIWPLNSIGAMRTALLLYFGLGLIAWIAFVLWQGWWTWGVYQGVRAIALAWYCKACGPQLRVAS
jgi:hypothetical protein